MSFFRRHRKLAIFTGAFIGVPTVSIAGLGVYIQYRIATKPPEHFFQPLVDETGRLLLEDCVIPAPTNFELFMRIVNLVSIFTPCVILYILVIWNPEKYHRWWLLRLRDAVEAAGPAFVKAGQWSCTRNDLFSPLFREVFQELFCEARTHPFAETKLIIEHDMKKPLDEIFQSIEELPIGSGSIGQVHQAVMKDGRKVAVKVMHPNVVENIAKDFFVINSIARWVHKYATSLEHYDIQTLGLAWTNHLAAQLDFRIEKEHLVLFRKHFADCDYVQFPEPYEATQRVLIEQFCVGEAATPEFLGKQEPHIRDVLAGKGLNAFMKMIMRDNFLHGDLHPGNILVNTKDPHNPIVYLIDVGLCQKMNNQESERNHGLMGAFVRWDPQLCSDSLWAMGSVQRFGNKEHFDQDMRDLFKRFRPVSGDESEVITNVLQAIFDVIRANRVTMDPTHVNILWAVLILESFIMALNENFNMVQHSAPWLVSEGHLSWKLLRNIMRTGRDVAVRELYKTKSKYLGGGVASAEDETFVPKHKERLALKLRAQQMAELEAKTAAKKQQQEQQLAASKS